MINTPQELEALLASTPLAHCKVISTPIAGSNEIALAIELNYEESKRGWHIARRLLMQTGRWPVLSATYNFPENLKKMQLLGFDSTPNTLKQFLENEDIFSRFFFEEEVEIAEAASPQALIQSAKKINYKNILNELREAMEDEEAKEYLPPYDATAPYPEDIKYARSDWGGNDAGSKVALIFLPTKNSWDAFAYIHWWGANNSSSKACIELARSWHERYHAELMQSNGVSAVFFVHKPARDLENAWEIASEHYLAAPAAFHIAGISLPDYAHGLVEWDYWWLFDRP